MAKELHTAPIEELVLFFDDVRFACVVEDGAGLEMISFLSSCPEIVRKTRIATKFHPGCFFSILGSWTCLKSRLGRRLLVLTDRIHQRKSSQYKVVCFQVNLNVKVSTSLVLSLNARNSTRVSQ